MIASAVGRSLLPSVLLYLLGSVTAMVTAQSAQWSESAVEIDGGSAPLRGTIAMPPGPSPIAAVLIIAGSGPTDRDGNQPGLRNDSLKLLARGLAGRGIASLRIDKRGIAASAGAMGSERDLRFGTYVSDAAAWVGFLRMQGRVRNVFLLGHSEGALVATLAAQQARVDGLILIEGLGFPAGTILRRQLDASGLTPSLRASAETIIASLEHGQLVTNAPSELAPLFRQSVQPYLISWLPLDPAAELAKVTAPTLVLQGTTDIQVSVENGERLRAARPDVELRVLDGVNHVLKEAPLDRVQNIATYSDPTLPLAPGVLPPIEAFLRKNDP